MKRNLVVLVGLLFGVMASAQVPVHFTYSAKKIDAKNYEVHVTATVDEGWHLYSGTQPKSAIALPTKIKFSANPLIKPVGAIKEIGKRQTYKNTEIGVTQYQYEGKVDFVQVIQLKAVAKTNINGSITYQVCTNEMCLPPATVKFDVKIE